MQINMLQAKNQLSRLVKAAIDGQDVIIASNGTPLVRLVPVTPKNKLGGWNTLAIEAEVIDAAFSPEVDIEVADLLAGR
jgi:prevent-host-death family protein